MTLTTSGNNPHLRTRSDHANETAEDYVEAIANIIDESESCRCVDLARCFAVSHVTVNRIVTRLEKQGLVSTEPYRPILLTVKVKTSGRQMPRTARHCVSLPGCHRD